MTIGSILQERTSSNMLSLNYLSRFSRILFLYPKEGKIFGVLFFFVDEVLCGDDLLYVNVFEGWHGAGGGDEFEKYGGYWFINPIVK